MNEGKFKPGAPGGGEEKGKKIKNEFPGITPRLDNITPVFDRTKTPPKEKTEVIIKVGDRVIFYGAGRKQLTGSVERLLEEPEGRIWAVTDEGQRYLLRPDAFQKEEPPVTSDTGEQKKGRHLGEGKPTTVKTLYEELSKLTTVQTGRGDVTAARVRQQVQDVYEGTMPIDELTNGGESLRLRDRLRAIMQREGKTIWETRERK